LPLLAAKVNTLKILDSLPEVLRVGAIACHYLKMKLYSHLRVERSA
jgi:hypothetical protein